MKIETKYNIGQEVWILYNNKVRTAKVISIHINVLRDIHVNYDIAINNYDVKPFEVFDDVIFPTKEELLKSL